VLRRPPLHKRANSDDTSRREARVLAALAGTDVPHPALIAACPDLEPLGAAFYLMEPVPGVAPALNWAPPLSTDPARQHGLGLSMAAAIAALSRVDPGHPSLHGLGRPESWLERQVGRWRRQLAGYRELDGYPGPDLPGVDKVADWLDAHQPTRWTPGLIHGDFHFANVLADPHSGAVNAIVDWELATIGDPLLDLGHLLATWPTHFPIGGGSMDSTGLPDTATIIEQYADLSGRDVREIRWYQVLACYRLGIILEGTHARAHAGQAQRETGDRLHRNAGILFRQALTLIDHPASEPEGCPA
jgi:aminoglycoside phosphotransferase (APT) family kinase protein